MHGKTSMGERRENERCRNKKMKRNDAMRWDIVCRMHERRLKDTLSMLKEPSLVGLLVYGHLDVCVIRLCTGLERRTCLETLKPCIAIVFLLCT